MADENSSTAPAPHEAPFIGANQDNAEAKSKRRRAAKIKAVPPAPVNVINLQEVRSARKMAERKPVNNSADILLDGNGEKRHLLWVSEREATLLSTMYQGRVNDAVGMVKAMMVRN
jgi:hypothetical protein